MAGDDRDEVILAEIRRFVELTGQLFNQVSWRAAGLRPSERTVRRRYSSFRRALELAGL